MAIEDFIWDGEKSIEEADPEEVMKAVYRHQGYTYAMVQLGEYIRNYVQDFELDDQMEVAIALNYIQHQLQNRGDISLRRDDLRTLRDLDHTRQYQNDTTQHPRPKSQ